MLKIFKIFYEIIIEVGYLLIDLVLFILKKLWKLLSLIRKNTLDFSSAVWKKIVRLRNLSKRFKKKAKELKKTKPKREFHREFHLELKSKIKKTIDLVILKVKQSVSFFLQIIKNTLLLPIRVLKLFVRKPIFFFFSGVLFSLLFIMLPYQVYVLASNLPTTDLLVEQGYRRSTKILDRNGNLLYEIYEDRKYEPVELDQIPEHVIESTLAIEDDRFYEHDGYRVDSILRALKAIILNDELQGGSTITQQLVKNVLLTPERTLSRKTKEIILSVLAEHRYSKDQILELYLNNISYGGTAWGVEAASQKFFNKHVWELDLAEASMLAGLPSAPSAYSPLNQDSSLAKNRQKQVLKRMVDQKYITPEEADLAFEKELNYKPQSAFIRAPHYVFYVRSLLEERYGSRFVTFGGLTVKTSLDLDLQEEVQSIVKEGVEANSYLNLTNGAALVLDSDTGEILAYVGSIDFFEKGWGAYDVITAERQPGSSIKPVTYALALSQDFTPATIINDSPTAFSIEGQPPYKPVNYDGRYHGKVTVRQALANSYNIPAVKVVEEVSPRAMVALGKKMGLRSWHVDDMYGLSVTLGGKEVKLLEHTNVYATLARRGKYKPVKPFLSIKDSKGKELIGDWSSEEEPILDSGVAYLITSILSDNSARAPAFGYRSPLHIPGYQVAVKTGTTDDKKDNWTMGYSPSYVVGVWVGNNDNSEMNRYLASGLTGAAPIWNSIMTSLLEDENQIKFEVPDEVYRKVDEKCGRSEYFLKGTLIPESLCPQKENKDSEDDD